MNRKDFEALADAIKCVRKYMPAGTLMELVDRVAKVCSNDNPNFNYETFRKACED